MVYSLCIAAAVSKADPIETIAVSTIPITLADPNSFKAADNVLVSTSAAFSATVIALMAAVTFVMTSPIIRFILKVAIAEAHATTTGRTLSRFLMISSIAGTALLVTNCTKLRKGCSASSKIFSLSSSNADSIAFKSPVRLSVIAADILSAVPVHSSKAAV